MGKFDAAIGFLNTAFKVEPYRTYIEYDESCIKSLESAIRLLEAAGKVDKKAALLWITLAKVTNDAVPYPIDPLAFHVRHDELTIRALLEALPDEARATKEKGD
jgi:hypothetical protein